MSERVTWLDSVKTRYRLLLAAYALFVCGFEGLYWANPMGWNNYMAAGLDEQDQEDRSVVTLPRDVWMALFYTLIGCQASSLASNPTAVVHINLALAWLRSESVVIGEHEFSVESEMVSNDSGK